MVSRKRRISLRRYIVPFVCCLLIAGISSAKMITVNSLSKNGQLQIAGWNVDVTTAESGSMTLDAGENGQTYTLTVTNNSDVMSSYKIKVSNIPAGVKVGLDISSPSDLVTPVGGEATFTNTGGDLGFTSPSNSRNHVLTMAAESTAATTQSGVSVAIDVLLVQKDPRI